LDLQSLFTPQGLLRDTDGDGIADGIRARLYVAAGPAPTAAAIEIAARLGLEVTGLTLPIAWPLAALERGAPPGVVPIRIELCEDPTETGRIRLQDGQLAITGGSAASLVAAARYLAAHHPEPELPAGVTEMVIGLDGTRSVLVAGEWRPLPGSVGEAAVIGAEEAGPPAQPPTDLTDLFSMTAGLSFPVPDELDEPLALGLVDLAARAGVEAIRLCFPLSSLPDEPLRPGLPVRLYPAANGGSVYLRPTELAVHGAPALALLAQTPDLGALRFCRAPSPPPAEELIAEWRWSDEGEVARFWRLWQEEVLPSLPPNQPVQVDLRLQEPRSVREALRQALLALLPPGSTVLVRTPFKQGFHWIEEEILPRLRALPGIARVELQFRAFQPMAEPALELPIRWLQECYPCDLLLEREIGLPLDAVEMRMTQTGPTYRFLAFDQEGRPLLDEQYEAVTGCRRYLDAFPERGWIHPPIGSLRVSTGTTEIVHRTFPTDLGRFWDWFQATILPAVRAAAVARHGTEPALAAQPLFGRLEVHLTASEEERRLGLREENISPLEALHEDLYFVTLDEMATWGRKLHGAPFDAPGTILPRPIAQAGAPPTATVRLTQRAFSAPTRAIEPIRVIHLRADGSLAWGDEAPTHEWRPAQATPHSHCAPRIQTPAEARLADVQPRPVPLDEIIGPENLEAHLAWIAQRPGVKVWQAGETYEGRPVWAVSLRPETGEAIRPPAKSSAMRPTLLINARHHANEVSSTNAVLRLIQEAADDPELVAFFRRVDLVAIPYENADGAQIHWQLAAENLNWKHHAARFNAVGLEFYGQYANLATPYTEARALAELFERWRPDVLLDDHGVPSHEWIQPFAGWNSAPYFRVSYWLPNALLYGIFRQFDPDQFPHHDRANRELIERLSRRAAADPDVSSWNQAWLQTYKRWGTDWDPERFPLEVRGGMINYIWPVRPHAFSSRFPEICVCDWVTEVPDETATGEHLARTARAHMLAHRATLEFLAAHPQPIQRRSWTEAGAVWREVGRPRPFRSI
jgi:hypothetical protein